MTKISRIFLIPLLLFNSPFIWASEQVGSLTQIEGSVKIFSHPSKTLPKSADVGGPFVLFDGEYYQVEDAKVGVLIQNGNIIRTIPGAKARVVYNNGDQIHVGSGTAYRISWNSNIPDSKTQIQLTYGRIRGIIEKGGPRSHLQIRTRAAVMGVRGTDFFVAQDGSDENTDISIIRGTVEITPIHTQAKPFLLEQKNSASIGASQTGGKVVSPQISLRKTTQEELSGIQKSSIIAPQDSQKMTPEIKKNVEQLEEKASATVLKDIQLYDKVLYAALEKQNLKKVDDINQAVVQKLIQEAPKAPPARKPFKSELEDIEDGAYKKYFKTMDE